MGGEPNEVAEEKPDGVDMVLRPSPVLAGLEIGKIGVLRGIGELVMLKVVLPVKIGGESNREGAEHVGGEVVPGAVPGQAVMGAFMHEDEEGVLARGDGDNDGHVEHPADEAEAGREAEPKDNSGKNDEPLDGNGGDSAPLGNLGEAANVGQHAGIGAEPFGRGIRRGWLNGGILLNGGGGAHGEQR